MGATIFIIAAVFCLLSTLCYLHQRFFAINTGRGETLVNLAWRKRSWGVKLGPPHFGVCCKLMQDYQGRSFSKEAAPPLPLPGCAMARCRCRYHFLRERRKGDERRRQMRIEAGRAERRSGRDRRRLTAQQATPEPATLMTCNTEPCPRSTNREPDYDRVIKG